MPLFSFIEGDGLFFSPGRKTSCFSFLTIPLAHKYGQASLPSTDSAHRDVFLFPRAVPCPFFPSLILKPQNIFPFHKKLRSTRPFPLPDEGSRLLFPPTIRSLDLRSLRLSSKPMSPFLPRQNENIVGSPSLIDEMKPFFFCSINPPLLPQPDLTPFSNRQGFSQGNSDFFFFLNSGTENRSHFPFLAFRC